MNHEPKMKRPKGTGRADLQARAAEGLPSLIHWLNHKSFRLNQRARPLAPQTAILQLSSEQSALRSAVPRGLERWINVSGIGREKIIHRFRMAVSETAVGFFVVPHGDGVSAAESGAGEPPAINDDIIGTVVGRHFIGRGRGRFFGEHDFGGSIANQRKLVWQPAIARGAVP